MRLLLLLVAMMGLCYPPNAQQLVSAELKGSRTLAQMQAQYGIFMENGVRFYKITYTTPGIEGITDTASGLLVVPVREGSYTYPLISTQNAVLGALTDVPSELRGSWELAVIFSGQGYVAAMADYLGLGESRGFHPYVHADTEASASIDLLFAVREYANQNGVFLNDQLFILGYSQGGHAAAAVHRTIQEEYADNFTVTASVPMAGPYDMSGITRERALRDEEYGFPAFIPQILLGYNAVYGLFEDISEYFKEPYDTPIRQFYQGEITLSSMNILLTTQLNNNEGSVIPKNILQDSILQILESNADHPLTRALADNDVYDWAPQAPMRLYYCSGDELIHYRNSVVADSVMTINGAPDVEAIDLNTTLDHQGCIEPAILAATFFLNGFKEVLVKTGEPGSSGPEISLFPNPAGSAFQLKGVPQGSLLQLLDLNGRVIRSLITAPGDDPIPVHSLAPGIYLIKVATNNGNWIERLVVNR